MTDDVMANIEITPREVKQRLDRGDKFLFIDVREPWENSVSSIDGAKLIPLREVPTHLAEFEQSEDVIFFCHHGMRSLDAAAWVRSQGIQGARSMAGGIARWSAEIDSRVPLY